MTRYKTRIELTCGQNEKCPERLNMYQRAWEIAKRYKIPTFFDSSNQSGDVYMDGYLYPCSNQVEKVLNNMEHNDIGFDNIDLPPELEQSEIAERLKKRYPHGYGVEVNTDWHTEECEIVETPEEPFSLWEGDE